jgi:hypothetical protein
MSGDVWLGPAESGPVGSCLGPGLPDLSVEVGPATTTTTIVAARGLEVPRYPLSGGVGGGDCEGVVGEVGDEVQAPAECLDVAGDGLDS